MKPLTLIKANVQHYGYKETYINPLKFDTPEGEVKMLSIIYESDKKEKIEGYEIKYAGKLMGIGETETVTTLPDFITLQ